MRSLATMLRRMSPRTLQRCLPCVALVGLLALALAGCGSSTQAPAGLANSGPGLQTSKPPWPPEYQHLAQRLHEIGIPPGGKETFHIHALLHIYVNGLLTPLPANIGLDPAKGIRRRSPALLSQRQAAEQPGCARAPEGRQCRYRLRSRWQLSAQAGDDPAHRGRKR